MEKNNHSNLKNNIMKPFFICCTFVLLLVSSQTLMGQSIPPTNTVKPRQVYSFPIGWATIVGSCDHSSTSGRIFRDTWANNCTVVNPPNGHTKWISGFSTETVESTITGLTIGVVYKLTYYAVELLSTGGDSDGMDYGFDGIIRAYIGGADYDYQLTGGDNCSWATVTFTFPATNTSMPIEFNYAVDPGPNGNMWNISLSTTAVTVDCAAGSVAPTVN